MKIQTFPLIFISLFYQFNFSDGKSDVVIIDPIIDTFMNDIKEIIKQSGHDPMDIPHIQDYITPAYVNLTEGVLTGAVNIMRSSNSNVTFSNDHGINKIQFKSAFTFKELIFKSNYSVRSFGFYSDTGTMESKIQNVRVGVRIDYNMENFTVYNNPFIKILKYSDITVTMESDSYINWLKNLIVNTAIPYYEEQITRIAQKTALEVAEKNIIKVNKLLEKPAEFSRQVMDFLNGLFVST